jgi:quercetin dioxygenase-like cupin family protein
MAQGIGVPWRGAAGALLLVGCAAHQPRIYVGELAPGLDAFLAAHPIASGANIRADEVGRTPGSSYQLVQVRGGESPHRHAAHDLTVVVLRGQGVLTLAESETRLGADDVVVVPRGAVHWFTNAGRDPAVALVVFTPPLDAPDTVPVGVVDSRRDGS